LPFLANTEAITTTDNLIYTIVIYLQVTMVTHEGGSFQQILRKLNTSSCCKKKLQCSE